MDGEGGEVARFPRLADYQLILAALLEQKSNEEELFFVEVDLDILKVSFTAQSGNPLGLTLSSRRRTRATSTASDEISSQS